jgi:hypothetical protein
MHKTTLVLPTLFAAVLAGAAYAEQPVTTGDESQYSFTYKCDSFRVRVDGHNSGTHTIYFRNDGSKVRNIGHHHITETHRNLQTGRTVEFRGDYTSTYDYVANTQTFTGAFLIGNAPMSGVLLQETGLVELNSTTGEIRTAGRHDILNLPYDPFCAALAG